MAPKKKVSEMLSSASEGARKSGRKAAQKGTVHGSVAESDLFSKPLKDLTPSQRRDWDNLVRLTHLQNDAVKVVTGEMLHQAIREMRKVAKEAGLRELTDRDWNAIAGKLARLRESTGVRLKGRPYGGTGHQNQLAGKIREMVTLHLPEMQQKVDRAICEALEEVSGKRGMTVFDTASHGGVELPTPPGKGYNPEADATDRIVGLFTPAKKKMEPVKLKMGDGSEELVEVLGEFEPRTLFEIKGGSNAPDAVKQLTRFEERGKQEYIKIDKFAYKLKLDPKKTLKRFAVVPEGGKNVGRAASKAEEAADKAAIEVMTYARKDEDALMKVTEAAFKTLPRKP